jgi:polyphosphate kinase
VPSTVLSRFVVMPDGERFVPLEQVIAAHLYQLFPGMVIESHHAFRVTRNADLTVEDEEAEDLLSAVETELRRRRFGYAVRLEVETTTSEEILELLQRELDLTDDDVYVVEGPLGLDGLWGLQDLDRPDLKYPAWQGVTEPPLSSTIDDDKVDVFARIREQDILLHHPYTSFSSSVEEFIRQSVDDSRVQAIKLTLYRTSGDSPIVHALIRAAESGKQVAALVELKARFDEAANIEWARRLEDAGVHVAYGVMGLKTHTKTTLVVREEEGRLHRYCHVGTGNYNPATARIYEDLGLLTDDPDLADDLTLLFNYLTGYARDVEYRKLLVAPDALRERMEDLIRQEIDAPPGTGRIVMKMNALVDDRMIDLLYEASRAGVEIDLIIRGICCLRAGVEGLSENIRVRSIVGRYLEHSRISYFANGEGPGRPAYHIGSADQMPRNLERRVEALAPVEASDLRERLDEIIDVELQDDVLAWTLDDATWRPPAPGGTVETHRVLQSHALKRTGRDV